MDLRCRRLNRIELIVHRRGRASEVISPVDLDEKWERDVVAHQLEQQIGQKTGDVAPHAGIKIVDAQNLVLLCDEPFAEFRPNEPGPARNKVFYLLLFSSASRRHKPEFPTHVKSYALTYASNCRIFSPEGLMH